MNSAGALLLLGAILVSGAGRPAPTLGSPFPDARLIEPEEKKGCGFRYRLQTTASAKDVANFYRAQAAAAHLSVTAEEGSQSRAFRLTIYGEKGPGRVLAVMMNPATSPVTARIYFVPGRSPSCG